MPLTVWVVRDAEPLPSDPGSKRLMRDGMLCAALAARGHSVVWLTSNFDHYAKLQRPAGPGPIHIAPNYRIEVLPGLGYGGNVSLRRIIHNWRFARAIKAYAAATTNRPDIIISDIPTTDAAVVSVRLARDWNIPSVVSIRDLWPDFFEPFIPAPLRLPARPFLALLARQAAEACSKASAVIGISEDYMRWGLQKAGRARSPADAIIPLGYPADALAETAPAPEAEGYLRSLGIMPEDQVVSFIGSWGRTYDLQTVIAAIARFTNPGNVKFVIAGNGEQRSALAAAIAADSSIIAPGWLDRDQIAWLLRRSAVGLMPYVANAPQGLPNKIFEYLAHGVFQVSTLPGEASTVLAELDAGLTCPPGDAAAMARAIAQALERAQSPTLKADLRAKFTTRYDATTVYEGFVDHIERLAHQGQTLKF